jgi:hypothetical protein
MNGRFGAVSRPRAIDPARPVIAAPPNQRSLYLLKLHAPEHPRQKTIFAPSVPLGRWISASHQQPQTEDTLHDEDQQADDQNL